MFPEKKLLRIWARLNLKRKALIWALLAMCLILCSCKKNTGSVEIIPEPVSTSAATPSPEVETTPSPEPTVRPSEIFVTQYGATDISTGERVIKNMSVYLPEGYDENEKYNAVFLMHISGSDENFWPGMGIQDIMDDLISSGEIEKTIVFMPDGYISDDVRGNRNDDGIYYQFAAELRDDIFPFIHQFYAVYDTREHYAFVGASFGSYMTVNSVLGPNLDLVKYFGCIGGGTIEQWRLEQSWSANGTGDLPVGMLYIAEGEYDDRGPAELSAMLLKSNCDKFDDTNLVFALLEGVGHEPLEWSGGFADAVRLFSFE